MIGSIAGDIVCEWTTADGICSRLRQWWFIRANKLKRHNVQRHVGAKFEIRDELEREGLVKESHGIVIVSLLLAHAKLASCAWRRICNYYRA